MAEIVNLRLARKAARRDAKRKAGDENAARHGLTPAERQAQQAEAGRAARRLDGHRREESEGGDGG
ncbi:MAG TPA: DUF4169 family protein [Paracoccus sp. (in: a-proteobacteria)]|nr:DUF4169 family protein [Paracoccus sp. (in: a-proteobacteria)]